MVAATQQEIEAFHSFALQRLNASSSSLTLDDLLVEWQSLRDRDDINAAIDEGVADMEAGRIRPAKEVTSELAAKHGLISP